MAAEIEQYCSEMQGADDHYDLGAPNRIGSHTMNPITVFLTVACAQSHAHGERGATILMPTSMVDSMRNR